MSEPRPRLRRTVSVDIARDEERGRGEVTLIGRDLVRRDGGVERRTDARGLLRCMAPRWVIEQADVIVDGCAEPAVNQLVGAEAMRGFRRVLGETLECEAERGSVVFGALDEIPTLFVISRASLPDRGLRPLVDVIDVCAGWQASGELAVGVAENGRLPDIDRPPAPDLDEGWHQMPALADRQMRRVRRFDAEPLPSGGYSITSMFRDHLRLAHATVIVHEYEVRATITRGGEVEHIEAIPKVLPGRECPQAGASVRTLIGSPLRAIRREVAATFAGTSTCTHLNDHLRALSDVGRTLESSG